MPKIVSGPHNNHAKDGNEGCVCGMKGENGERTDEAANRASHVLSMRCGRPDSTPLLLTRRTVHVTASSECTHDVCVCGGKYILGLYFFLSFFLVGCFISLLCHGHRSVLSACATLLFVVVSSVSLSLTRARARSTLPRLRLHQQLRSPSYSKNFARQQTATPPQSEHHRTQAAREPGRELGAQVRKTVASAPHTV